MSDDVTARDRVWAALIKMEDTRFTVDNVRNNISTNERALAYGSSAAESTVSDDTIKRVLRAGTELGLLKHESGSKYYEKKLTVEVEKRW